MKHRSCFKGVFLGILVVFFVGGGLSVAQEKYPSKPIQVIIP